MRPKARQNGSGSLARSAEGGAGTLHRDQDQGEVMEMAEPLLLRTSEVAAVLGIGRTEVFELLRNGDLPVVRLGRCVRVPRTALAMWIAERTS